MFSDPDNDDFVAFLQEVLNTNELDDAAVGITKQVMDRGEDSLSEKQAFVFQTRVRNEYTIGQCTKCASPIPWSEMFIAVQMNDGQCSWCSHMSEKAEKD